MIEQAPTTNQEETMKSPFENIKVTCSKHGDISGGVRLFVYKTIQPGSNPPEYDTIPEIMCSQCLVDMYVELQNQGKIGSLTVEEIK